MARFRALANSYSSISSSRGWSSTCSPWADGALLRGSCHLHSRQGAGEIAQISLETACLSEPLDANWPRCGTRTDAENVAERSYPRRADRQLHIAPARDVDLRYACSEQPQARRHESTVAETEVRVARQGETVELEKRILRPEFGVGSPTRPPRPPAAASWRQWPLTDRRGRSRA
jgi:hypothetical protein